MSGSVYLDYNATSPVRPEAVLAVAEALAGGGNPSSVHAAGRAARARLENSRAAVAALVGANADEVTFVSGGTEADAMAIRSAVAAGHRSIVVGAIEHEAVRRTAEETGLAVEVWPVGREGAADLDWLRERLRNGEPRPLVCLMLANNETGVVQPVAEAARLVREGGGWLHVDAVQAAGKIEVDFRALGAHTLALSAHKIGGPHGVGAIIVDREVSLAPMIHGGGQERGLRAGTENTAGACGFAAAATASLRDLKALGAQATWRDELATRLVEAGAEAVGAGAARLPQTLCVAKVGFASELQVIALDLAAVMVSSGAACSSGKVRSSGIVTAMGRSDLAPFSIRVSGGWATSREEWGRCGDAWLEAWERCSARRRAVA